LFSTICKPRKGLTRSFGACYILFSPILSRNSPPGAPVSGTASGVPVGETMKQEYFVVVLAHSLRGRLRRIHVPHQAVYAILAFALLGFFSFFGFVASYARMVGKVANYNTLKREADSLRTRYQSLQSLVNQKNEQLATLQIYAKEVSLAFGI